MKKFCMDMHYLKIFILFYALEWREDILTIFAALFGYLLIVTSKKISVVSVIRVDARVGMVMLISYVSTTN